MDLKRTYTIQESGLTLPAEWFEKYGLKQGDEVTVLETEDGLMVLPNAVAALMALDDIGRGLQERGVTLDELMARGRDIRGDILREKYGLTADDNE